jgi:hypothetical protein
LLLPVWGYPSLNNFFTGVLCEIANLKVCFDTEKPKKIEVASTHLFFRVPYRWTKARNNKQIYYGTKDTKEKKEDLIFLQ